MVALAKSRRFTFNNPAEHSWTNIENVFPVISDWINSGIRFVIVSLIQIEGGSTRPLGAQMAISETGESFGHISGGCLKQEIIERSLEQLNKNQNRTIRYGKGSEFMDITLPCGSSLDLYFDVNFSKSLIAKAHDLTLQRIPFSIVTNLENGHSILQHLLHPQLKKCTEVSKTQFSKIYHPTTNLIILGTDPAVHPLAKLGSASDMDVKVYTPDTGMLDTVTFEGIDSKELVFRSKSYLDEIDPWTAVVLYFHDHGWERILLPDILESDCFYLGVLGSKKTSRLRADTLQTEGITADKLRQIHGPIGLIDQTRSPTELAISTLAEIVNKAKKAGMVC